MSLFGGNKGSFGGGMRPQRPTMPQQNMGFGHDRPEFAADRPQMPMRPYQDFSQRWSLGGQQMPEFQQAQIGAQHMPWLQQLMARFGQGGY